MQTILYVVGMTNDHKLNELAEDYRKRIERYHRFDILTIPDIKNKGKLNGKGTQVIKAGDIIEIFTPGGAGLGDYSERNENLIKIDKENELL